MVEDMIELERDWRIQCTDYEDPPEPPKCRECRFSCQAHVKDEDGPWLCLWEALECGAASAIVIDPDDDVSKCDVFEID